MSGKEERQRRLAEDRERRDRERREHVITVNYAPAGYRLLIPQEFVVIACLRCGALVDELSRLTHDDWHATGR